MSKVRTELLTVLGSLQTPEVAKLLDKHERGINSAGTKLRAVLNQAQKDIKRLYQLVQEEREASHEAEDGSVSLLPADGGTPDGGTTPPVESGTIKGSK